METYTVKCSEHLFDVNISVFEIEHEGKLHSNRNRNAIKTLLKRYPELAAFYREQQKESGGMLHEDVSIANFSLSDYTSLGHIAYDRIREVVKGVPRPYGVTDLHLIYSGISFGESDSKSVKITPSKKKFGTPAGSYIAYERTHYGSEMHAYVSFSIGEEHLETMRKLFFEFAERIPGKYDGTECVEL